jgi:hypothetical protein
MTNQDSAQSAPDTTDLTPTVSRLNAFAGRKVFAEMTDIYGRPLDGWAMPVITTQHDAQKRIVAVTMGTFRLSRKDNLASVRHDISPTVWPLVGDPAAYLGSLYDQLFAKLVETLKQLEPA